MDSTLQPAPSRIDTALGIRGSGIHAPVAGRLAPDTLARRLEPMGANNLPGSTRVCGREQHPPDPAALDDFLAASRERVNAVLDEVLPAETQHPRELHRALRYAVFSGGKRLRPTLALGSAMAGGADPEQAMPVAIATELVHTCSLVLDDLPAQDDNAVRRGRSAAHIAFGSATAILAGSALLAEAFAQCTRLPDPYACAAVGAGLTDTIGSRGLIGGQVDDLAFSPSETSLEEVAHIHLRKTAALFRFSAWSGGVAAGLSGEHLDRLDAFGCAYGLAFQVVDDLLDADPRECSMLHVLSRHEARGRIRRLLDQGAREIEVFGPDGWVLAGLARRLEGLIL